MIRSKHIYNSRNSLCLIEYMPSNDEVEVMMNILSKYLVVLKITCLGNMEFSDLLDIMLCEVVHDA